MRTSGLLRIALVAGALLGPPAHARFGVSPIDRVVGESAIVVEATIISGRATEYRYRQHADTCGFIYEARVGERFKGSAGDVLVFASNLSMAPGTRQLLFLREYAGDFPSDVYTSIEDVDDPDFGTRVDEARAACVARLPRLKSTYLHAGKITPATLDQGQSVDLSRWIGPVPGLAFTGDEWSQRIEWSRLRAWLLANVRDIADYSAAAERCNAACRTRQLEEADAVMLRNHAALRDLAARRPQAAAAVDAAQAAWHNHADASCMSFAEVQAAAAQSVPAGTCRLEFTRARARELWLLRQIAMAGGTDPTCKGACVDEGLASITQTMERFLADSRRRPGASTSIDDGQKAWQTYLGRHCAAEEAIIAGDAATASGTACSWRLTQERIGELGWLYLRD